MPLTKNQLLEIDYYLRLTRTLEERLVALFRQAKVIGGLYRSLGQEGESVAAAYALDYKQGDVVQPLIRNIGSILVAGAKPADIIKQYMAKGDSPTRGRELNIHFGHPAKDGFIGQISMLGDMIPVMAGVALAGRMQKKKLVCLAFIGDGGSSTGAFWEGMNFAAVQKLPMVVIVEDNGYAYSTPTRNRPRQRPLRTRRTRSAVSAKRSTATTFSLHEVVRLMNRRGHRSVIDAPIGHLVAAVRELVPVGLAAALPLLEKQPRARGAPEPWRYPPARSACETAASC